MSGLFGKKPAKKVAQASSSKVDVGQKQVRPAQQQGQSQAQEKLNNPLPVESKTTPKAGSIVPLETASKKLVIDKTAKNVSEGMIRDHKLKSLPNSDFVIKKFEEVPNYKRITTLEGGLHAVSEAYHNNIAVLDIEDNDFVILVTNSFYGGNFHLTLKSSIIAKGGKVAGEYVIEDGAIRILYVNNEKTTLKEVSGMFNEELTDRINKMLKAAVDARVTDLHICARNDTYGNTGGILFRIDGYLRVWEKFPYEDLLLLTGYMYTKLAAESSRSEASFNPKANQACTIELAIDGLLLRVRYQSVRVSGGFDVIMRLLLLNKDDKSLTLEQLGYSRTQCKELDLASRKSVGVIIISGVTGSGKSTTLKTLMTMNPDMNLVKSYSIEDPVEYKIFGVSQIGVQRSSAQSSTTNPYLETMRVIMRADPDVIMPGETRDIHSTDMLQTMVQSGHQVMTTVHASSAIEIVDRMCSKEMGMSRHTMSTKSFLSALVYQKLIPCLCKHCKLPAHEVVDNEMLELMERKFGISTNTFYAANEINNECEFCGGTGIRGVTTAAEIILPTPEFLKLIRDGKDQEAEIYWRNLRKVGFDHEDMTGKTAFEHGLYKVTQGLIDPRHLEKNFDPIESYIVYDIVK